MATQVPQEKGFDEKSPPTYDTAAASQDDYSSIKKGDLLSLESVDPVLNEKMHLVNNAIDEIGFTTYHIKLFILTGFGYAVDSMLLLIQSVVATTAGYEFHEDRGYFKQGLTIAVYVGMLIGALFWGFSADIIGRKYAFNFSLIISSVFAIVAGAAPNWIVLGLFVALTAFGSGGNLVLDASVFLEYLPSKYSWLVTLLAAWWGVGQLIAGLFAWAFLPNYSCPGIPADTGVPCNWSNNAGWRYIWFACGALTFVLSILRITVIHLGETPKFLIADQKDEEVVATFQKLATKYNRPCSLTLERLQRCDAAGINADGGRRGSITAHASTKASLGEVWMHLKGLFTKSESEKLAAQAHWYYRLLPGKIGLSTLLIWWSWLLIGLAYPLYNVFLPSYIASRGAALGGLTVYEQWRNYAIANVCSIPGPVLAGLMCNQRIFWGRRGTMIIGAIITMAFFFGYTQITSNAQNLGITCAISFCLNIYYATLYAYTPEVLPSAHRGTGYGIAISMNRIMGIVSAGVAAGADTTTSVPIFLCAALYIVMAGTAAIFPFEPLGRRSS